MRCSRWFPRSASGFSWGSGAALLAGLPLALGSGSGSELRRPLGIAIVGGLIFSQLLTLYTTPVIYLAFDRLARRVAGKKIAPAPELAPAGGTGS